MSEQEGSASKPDDAASQPPVSWLASPPSSDEVAEPPRPIVRIAEALAWLAGVAAVLVFGRVLPLLNPPSGLTSYEQGFRIGVVVGGVVVAILLGLAVRWAWVRLRKRGRVRSPWILAIATIALIVGLLRDPTVGAIAGADLPIETYLHVGSPYALVIPPADVADGFEHGFGPAVSNVEVREIRIGEDPVGYLVVVDAHLTESDTEFLRGFETGFEGTPGVEAHSETIAGRSGLVGAGLESGFAAWTEPPYAIIVYAINVDSARLLATSVISAYE